MVPRLAGVALFAALCLPAPAGAQNLRSGDLAKQLTQLLDSRKLDIVAAADTQSPGTYIAAMYFPGTQLLVVSARYAAPQMLTELLARKDYRAVYVELTSASVQSSRLFVRDAYANGLSPKRASDQPADSVERAGVESTFDGGWKKAKVSEADYMKSFNDADAAYTHVLQLLINSLKASGT
jgi:hypothetical protein